MRAIQSVQVGEAEKKETAERREPRETREEKEKYDDRVITRIHIMYTKDGYGIMGGECDWRVGET